MAPKNKPISPPLYENVGPLRRSDTVISRKGSEGPSYYKGSKDPEYEYPVEFNPEYASPVNKKGRGPLSNPLYSIEDDVLVGDFSNPVYDAGKEEDDDSVSTASADGDGEDYMEVRAEVAPPIQDNPLTNPRKLSPANPADAELRKKLNELARAIMDKKNPTSNDINDFVKSAKFSEAQLTSLKLDAAKLAKFVSDAQSGGGVSDTHAAEVGFIRGAGGQQNHIEWVSNPSTDPLKFLHQRLLLASTSDQVRTKDGGISKVKKQLRQGRDGEEYGLQKAYNDTNTDNSNPTWLGLGLYARFEDVIHRRYQELAAKPLRRDAKDPKEALQHLSYNQFGAFIRKAIEHDAELPARYQAEMEEVLRLQQDLQKERALIDNLLTIDHDEDFGEEAARRLSEIESEHLDLRKKYEGLKVAKQRAEMDITKFYGLERKSDMELSALVGAKGNGRVDSEGNFDRGLDGTGRYSLFFLRMMEDNGDLLAAAIEANKDGAFKARLEINHDFAENLKANRSLIFNLNEKEFACLVNAVENRSVVVKDAAEKGRQGRKVIPLKDIYASRERMLKTLTSPQQIPEWWSNKTINLLQANKKKLQGGNAAEKTALVQAYIDLKTELQSEKFKADLEATGITLQDQLNAVIAEYDRQIQKLKVVGEYKFLPLALQSTDADLSVSNPATPNLHSRDGDRLMYIEEMKGDKAISLDGGLIVQVHDGNKGFDEHSRQFEKLSEAKFYGQPLCSIARFDGRDPGDGQGTRNDYCIVTVTSQNTTKTFISEAIFNKIAEQNAADFERYAKHLTKVKGLQEILDIMYVSIGDLAGQPDKADDLKSLAKEADGLKKILNGISFSEDDSVEEREAKINRLNRFSEDKLKRQTGELKKLLNEALSDHSDARSSKIGILNRWLVDNSVKGVVFDGTEDPSQAEDKIKAAGISLEQNKSTIFNVSDREISKSGIARISEIEQKMVSGAEISDEAKREAQAYASHATNDHLSKRAAKQLSNNHFRLHLDSHQIEKMMDEYGSKDGHLWMKGTDKKDFEKLLRAALPVSPVPGGVSIVKPRLGDKNYIRFADPSKNNSNGGPNFAQVTFAADADGNFTGDDMAFVCLPGTNNIYVKVMVARQEGTMPLPDGSKVPVKKGDVKIFQGYVFHKNKDGSYDTIDTSSTALTKSALTKHFGKSKGDEIREIATNFSLVVSSVIGNEPCAVAVSFNGKTCDSRKLVKPRLAPVRDQNDPDRNISTVFEVDSNGRYLNDLPNDKDDKPQYHRPHPDYPKHNVIARGMSEIRAFYGNGDAYHEMEANGTTPYCKEPFKIVLRVCVLEDEKGGQSFAKQLMIETFDAKGDPKYQPLNEAELAKVTTDEFDRKALISEIEDLAKKADVVVGVKGPDGKEATSILKSTDDRWFKEGVRKFANNVMAAAGVATVLPAILGKLGVPNPLALEEGNKSNSPTKLVLKTDDREGFLQKMHIQKPDKAEIPTPVLTPAISATNMGPALGLGQKGRGVAAAA